MSPLCVVSGWSNPRGLLQSGERMGWYHGLLASVICHRMAFSLKWVLMLHGSHKNVQQWFADWSHPKGARDEGSLKWNCCTKEGHWLMMASPKYNMTRPSNEWCRVYRQDVVVSQKLMSGPIASRWWPLRLVVKWSWKASFWCWWHASELMKACVKVVFFDAW